jgi:hypothetical protein
MIRGKKRPTDGEACPRINAAPTGRDMPARGAAQRNPWSKSKLLPPRTNGAKQNEIFVKQLQVRDNFFTCLAPLGQ